MKIGFVLLSILILQTALCAQDWPDKIRGYKVYDAKVAVSNAADQTAKTDKADAYVKIGEPKIAEIGLFSVSVETNAEIIATKQNGQVEFVMFRDIRINGVAVEIEEYNHPFSFKKGESLMLPKPARVSISVTSLPRAAYKELTESRNDLTVTGTAFAFGKFKKYGFNFKRVVPIKINLKIKNPLRSSN